jgi:hypothetical protein
VAHACNPSYSGGRDQEDCSLKPARTNSSGDPILKISITKKDWWSASRCGPWVQTPVLHSKQTNIYIPQTKPNLSDLATMECVLKALGQPPGSIGWERHRLFPWGPHSWVLRKKKYMSGCGTSPGAQASEMLWGHTRTGFEDSLTNLDTLTGSRAVLHQCHFVCQKSLTVWKSFFLSFFFFCQCCGWNPEPCAC